MINVEERLISVAGQLQWGQQHNEVTRHMTEACNVTLASVQPLPRNPMNPTGYASGYGCTRCERICHAARLKCCTNILRAYIIHLCICKYKYIFLYSQCRRGT